MKLADNQKKFRDTSDPKTEFISSGLWQDQAIQTIWRDHAYWYGCIILSSLSGIEYVTAIVSPVFVYYFKKSRGRPMLSVLLKTHGDLPEYQQYKENISCINDENFSKSLDKTWYNSENM